MLIKLINEIAFVRNLKPCPRPSNIKLEKYKANKKQISEEHYWNRQNVGERIVECTSEKRVEKRAGGWNARIANSNSQERNVLFARVSLRYSIDFFPAEVVSA